MGNQHQSVWNKTNERQLRRLAARGKTASYIAKQLGLTRNMVIGKCWREGIKLGGKNPKGYWLDAKQLAQLRGFYNKNLTKRLIAEKMGRSYHGMRGIIHRLQRKGVLQPRS